MRATTSLDKWGKKWRLERKDVGWASVLSLDLRLLRLKQPQQTHNLAEDADICHSRREALLDRCALSPRLRKPPNLVPRHAPAFSGIARFITLNALWLNMAPK
jgi:hypothetical protein